MPDAWNSRRYRYAAVNVWLEPLDPEVIVEGERTSYKTTYVWRTARRTEKKFPRNARRTRFFGDETTSNYTTNALQDEQSSYVFDAHSTHFSASNRKRNARRKTYEAL